MQFINELFESNLSHRFHCSRCHYLQNQKTEKKDIITFNFSFGNTFLSTLIKESMKKEVHSNKVCRSCKRIKTNQLIRSSFSKLPKILIITLECTNYISKYLTSYNIPMMLDLADFVDQAISTDLSSQYNLVALIDYDGKLSYSTSH
jgi:hypothetical protein